MLRSANNRKFRVYIVQIFVLLLVLYTRSFFCVFFSFIFLSLDCQYVIADRFESPFIINYKFNKNKFVIKVDHFLKNSVKYIKGCKIKICIICIYIIIYIYMRIICYLCLRQGLYLDIPDFRLISEHISYQPGKSQYTLFET